MHMTYLFRVMGALGSLTCLRISSACAASSCATMQERLPFQETKWKTSTFPKVVHTEHDNYIFVGLNRSSYLDVFCLSLLVYSVDCRQEFSEEFIVPVILFSCRFVKLFLAWFHA